MEDFDYEQEALNDIDYRSNNKGPWKKIYFLGLTENDCFTIRQCRIHTVSIDTD